MMAMVKVCTPRQAKGLSFQTVVLTAHRRQINEESFFGENLRDPAFIHVPMTRTSEKLYLLVEVLSQPVPTNAPRRDPTKALKKMAFWVRLNDFLRKRQGQYDNLRFGIDGILRRLGIRDPQIMGIQTAKRECEAAVANVNAPVQPTIAETLVIDPEYVRHECIDAIAAKDLMLGKARAPQHEGLQGMAWKIAKGEVSNEAAKIRACVAEFKPFILTEAIHTTFYGDEDKGTGLISIPVMSSIDRPYPDVHHNALPYSMMALLANRINLYFRLVHHKGSHVKLGHAQFYHKACGSDRPEAQVYDIGTGPVVWAGAYWGMGVERQHRLLYGLVVRVYSWQAMIGMLEFLRDSVQYRFNAAHLATDPSTKDDMAEKLQVALALAT
jgi:hypothetical protein